MIFLMRQTNKSNVKRAELPPSSPQKAFRKEVSANAY